MRQRQRVLFLSLTIVIFLTSFLISSPLFDGRASFVYLSQVNDLYSYPEWIHGFSLILLNCDNVHSASRARDYVFNKGGSIAILSPPHAMVGWIPPEIVDELIGNYGIEAIYFSPIDIASVEYINGETISLIKFFNYVTSGEHERSLLLWGKKGEPLINDALEVPPLDVDN